MSTFPSLSQLSSLPCWVRISSAGIGNVFLFFFHLLPCCSPLELACEKRRQEPQTQSTHQLLWIQKEIWGSVCKVRTQDPENFDEEVKSLVTAWFSLYSYPLLNWTQAWLKKNESWTKHNLYLLLSCSTGPWQPSHLLSGCYLLVTTD
jgi:hypothetical protein